MDNEIAIIVRWRPKNYYSFASLVPILKSFGYPLFLLQKDPFSDFENIVNKYKFVIYFDSFMSIDVPLIKSELREYYSIASKNPLVEVIYCCGGSHPTAAPEHTISLGFNIVARGEGEIIIKRIMEVLQEGLPLTNIPGITFKDELGLLQHTPNPVRIDLNDFIPYSEDPPITPPIEIMRGCSFGCKFCQTPRVLRKVRYRSIESIEKIVSFYATKFQTRRSIDIRFIAPNSLEYGSKTHRTPNMEALWSLVDTVKKYPVRMFLGSFPSEIRPEFITPETVAILQKSDSKKVALGAQSGSDSMLKKMKRGHTLKDIISGVDFLLDGDLIPQLDFILGNPEENETEQLETLALCEDLLKKGCQIRLHYFMPLPGTPWGNEPPSKLSYEVKSQIFTLLNDPNVNGSFSQQMEISNQLLQYR
jgi:B12-binding domain/radical SAM domain protein